MNVRQRRKLFAGAGLLSMLMGALMVVMPAGAGAHHLQTTPTPSIPTAPNVLCGDDPEGPPIGLGYEHEVAFGSIASSPDDVDSAVVEGVSWTSSVVDGVRHFEWTSTMHTVMAVIVKQADGAAVFSYEPDGAMAGSVYVATGTDKTGISHLAFCYDTEEEPSLTVTKQIASTDASVLDDEFPVTVEQAETAVASGDLADGESLTAIDPASGDYVISEVLPATGWQAASIDCGDATVTGAAAGPWTVTVGATDVACTITNTPTTTTEQPSLTVTKQIASNDSTLLDDEFPVTVKQGEATVASGSLSDDESLPAIDPASGSYVITETVPMTGWQAPSINCGTATVTGSNPWTVTVATTDVACTITNTPQSVIVIPTPPVEPTPPAVQSLQVVKRAIGATPDDWTVDFEVVGGDLDVTETVDDVITSEVFGDVEAGTYVITERNVTEAERSALQDVSCVDDDGPVASTLEGSTATVQVAEGEDVVCTFTNVYTQVLPDVVVPTPTPPAVTPTPLPTPQVQGAVVTRQLPRTGNESGELAAFGAGLLAMGAAMVLGSRMRFRRID